MEYSKLAQGSVVSLGGSTPVVLPFLPDYVEIDNFTAATTPASGGVTKGIWYSGMGQGTGLRYVFNGTPVLTTSTLTTGGISTFTASTPQLGSSLAISGITKASAGVVTTTGNHGLVTGNVVILTGLFQSSTTGMPQISNIPFVVTVTGATTFSIPYNTNQSSFTALSGSPAGASVRQVLYPYLYFPGVNVVTALTLASTTTVTTAANHNLVTGQQVGFFIPSQWGTVELNSPNSLGQQVTGYVSSVTNATTVVVALNTASGYTAFNSNPTVAQALAGMSFPQMIALGDNNTGSITNSFLPTTINSATIGGAFQNNTRQGLIIGASLAGTAADVLYYRAYAHDKVN